MSNENTQASSESRSRKQGEAARPRKQTVILDYRGTVGRSTVEKGGLRNEAAVPHRLSPLMAFWPENGQADLQLQPGVNVVSAELWKFYSETAKGSSGASGHPQIMEMVKALQIRELSGISDDTSAVLELVKRSIDHDGLRWIETQENAGEQRQEVLDAIADRLAKARPIKIKPSSFQRSVPAVKGTDAPQPSMAMG